MKPRAVIGRTMAESVPVFEPLPRPRAGAPNVVMIVLDDLGFAQLGCFGADLETPAIDAVAQAGLRFNHFHVTALCSPTRACLLTGRNHHAVGMGFLTDIPIGLPGYNARIPRSAATLPRLLRDAGYSTFAAGKWHLTPRWEQSASGPFTRWPLGLGFERYYGFLNGDTNQWTPELVCDNAFVEPPRRPEEGYHVTEDLADKAMRMIQDQQQATPEKPFFLYFATGATHAPHHAPRPWIERYHRRFDDGWEAWRQRTFARQIEMGIVPEGTTLTPRPAWVPAWNDLPAEHRRLFARGMEAFAGFLSHTDAQIGRLLSFLETLGCLDNTLVLILSDNGASAEGGPIGSFNEHRFIHDRVDDLEDSLARIDDIGGVRAYNHYAWGWAWAGNTPLHLWKRYTWLGGVRTPLIVRWTRHAGQPQAQVRSQFCHAVDLMPTILDAAGVEAPDVLDGITQQPFDGASLLPLLTDANLPPPRRTQYFEMLGSRAIYHDGWKATTDHVGAQLTVEREAVPGSSDLETDHWALFDLRHDFAETEDVGAQHPERLQAMIELWAVEAGRNNVLPVMDSFLGRATALEPSPWGPRWRAILRPGGGPVSEDVLPPLGSGFRLRADVELAAGAGGILCALGDWSNGWAWYVLDGVPVLTFNILGEVFRFAGDEPLRGGRHTLGAEYAWARKASRMLLTVDGRTVAEGPLPRRLPMRWQIGGAGLLIARDRGFPVCDDYAPPFPFAGHLDRLIIEVPALAPRDAELETLEALHRE
jgi:arylsulfatase